MKKKITLLLVMIFFSTFLFSHTSSDRALRLTVLLNGFPKEAITSDIEYVFKHDENTKYYFLEPTPVSHQTGPTNAWKAKQVGIFYFASYYGA
ncbi:hypothetical protein [Vagococcus bubulae]|uniref:Uncharacterized protein n=1 Tax=Vagococcus bubulae TaxID=1977868 RepID=A0A429ZRB3_9ENTE|nr:hypothetical protein [Vagococcus bubulae]RST96227.1 hypothetical protein CBF36_00405 [Vagococcus bubulae]